MQRLMHWTRWARWLTLQRECLAWGDCPQPLAAGPGCREHTALHPVTGIVQPSGGSVPAQWRSALCTGCAALRRPAAGSV